MPSNRRSFYFYESSKRCNQGTFSLERSLVEAKRIKAILTSSLQKQCTGPCVLHIKMSGGQLKTTIIITAKFLNIQQIGSSLRTIKDIFKMKFRIKGEQDGGIIVLCSKDSTIAHRHSFITLEGLLQSQILKLIGDVKKTCIF